MIILRAYQLDTVFQAMEVTRNRKSVLPDGRTFKGKSPRLILFKSKGVKCVNCDNEGNVFILETHSPAVTPHLNLYAVTATGEMILMTKDHHQPQSKGGANDQDNYNTMCSPCNAQKADNLPE